MQRILITGTQGFVGRYLSSCLLGEDPTYQILGIGRSPVQTKYFTHQVNWAHHSILAPLPPGLDESDWVRYRYERADICDCEQLGSLLKDFQPDLIFHLASGLRDDAPLNLCRTNIEG